MGEGSVSVEERSREMVHAYHEHLGCPASHATYLNQFFYHFFFAHSNDLSSAASITQSQKLNVSTLHQSVSARSFENTYSNRPSANLLAISCTYSTFLPLNPALRNVVSLASHTTRGSGNGSSSRGKRSKSGTSGRDGEKRRQNL